jgi:hypothetical protein
MGRKIIPQKDFYFLGDQIMCTNKEERYEVPGGQPQHLVKENVSRFVSNFGTTPLICQCLWAFFCNSKGRNAIIPSLGPSVHEVLHF